MIKIHSLENISGRYYFILTEEIEGKEIAIPVLFDMIEKYFPELADEAKRMLDEIQKD